ncbi:MAG: tetratricopeptide repeat protein [Gemmatimonadota bacterium]
MTATGPTGWSSPSPCPGSRCTASETERHSGAAEPVGSSVNGPANKNLPEIQPALIGREAEMAELGRRLSEAGDRHGSATIVGGETGTGKTRLLDEVAKAASKQGFLVLRGEADAADEKLPYGLFAGVLTSYLAADPEGARAPVADLVGELAPHLWSAVFPKEPAPRTEGATGSPELRQTLFLAKLVSLLSGVAERRPLLVTLDDLQWADSSSLQAFHHLSQRVASTSLVVVAAVRTETEPRAREAHLRRMLQELHLRASFYRLEISALTAEQTRALAVSCFRREGLSAEIFEFLQKKSGGVPLLAVQFLQFLLEQGVIYQEHGLWVSRRLEEGDMPESVRAAIRRRLEGLTEPERELLSLAAVQGDQFEGGLLASAMNQPVTRTLRELGEVGRRTHLLRAAGRGFRLAHPVLTEAFYQMLPETKRRHLHMRLAYVLQRERPDQTEKLARHLFCAGLYDRALPYLVQAAQRAHSAHAYREARLLLVQAQGAAEALNGNAPKDTGLQLQLLLAEVQERLGEPELCLDLCQEILRRADATAGKAAMAGALLLTGWVQARQASWNEALRSYGQALEIYSDLGDEVSVATVHLRVGNIAFERSRLEEAEQRFRDARAAAEKAGHYMLLGSIDGNLGIVATVRGDHLQAIVHYTEAIRAYSRIKHRYGICQTYQNLGMCHAGQQEWEAALSCYNRGEVLARELGTVDVLANLLVSRAVVHLRRGELEDAEVAGSRAQTLMEQLANRIGLAECRKVKGMVSRERGRPAEAIQELSQAAAAFQVLENELGVAECQLELALVERQQGEKDRARRRLQDAVQLFEKVGAAGDARRGEAMLAEMAA